MIKRTFLFLIVLFFLSFCSTKNTVSDPARVKEWVSSLKEHPERWQTVVKNRAVHFTDSLGNEFWYGTNQRPGPGLNLKAKGVTLLPEQFVLIDEALSAVREVAGPLASKALQEYRKNASEARIIKLKK